MKKGIWADRAFNGLIWAAAGALAIYLLAVLLTLTLHIRPESWTKVLVRERVLFSLRLSLLCATIASLLGLLFAIPAAYLLARRHFPGKDLLDTLLDIPTVLSPVALGTALLLFFGSGPGRIFEEHGIRFTFVVSGIILAQFSVVVGLAVRSLKAVFESLSPRYEAVALFLGCNKWGTFFKVILPMARNGIITSFILVWARAIGEFGCTITLAGAVPGKTETIPAAIYLGLAEVDIQETLIYVLLLVLVAVVVLLSIRYLARKRRAEAP